MRAIAFYDPEFDEVHTSYMTEDMLVAQESKNELKSMIHFFIDIQMADV